MKRYKRLKEADRVTIQVLTKKGYSDAEIAREIRVHRSSVGRERRRNTVDGKYYYHLAQELADKRLRAKRRRQSKMSAGAAAACRAEWPRRNPGRSR